MATNSAIRPISNRDLAEGTMFNERQIELIKNQIMPGASDDDLILFTQVASHRKLDPFMKHIYAVKRRNKVDGKWVDKWEYQTSIDGLRLIAQRSGRYRGQTPPEWCGLDGKWVDVWLSEEPPAAARIGVWIGGNPQPLYAIALYKTFVQTYTPQNSETAVPTKFWKEMPEHMLAKVAEAQAIRKAFPEEAGGLYTPEEMAQASNERPYVDADGVIETTARVVETQPAQPRRERPMTTLEKAKVKLWQLAHDVHGWDQEQLAAVGHKLTGAPLKEADEERLIYIHDTILAASPDELDAMLADATKAA